MPGYVATCPNGSPAGYGGRVSEMPKIQTLGELRAAGYTHRSLREELRENLLSALAGGTDRSEEHTSELQSRGHLVCRLLLEKKKPKTKNVSSHEHIVTHQYYV